MAHTFPAATDHSWGRPGAEAIKRAGYVGVMRYLGDPVNGKNLGISELQTYHDAGLLVGFCWETVKDRVLSGFNGGSADGPRANYWADQLGVPLSVPIVGATVDFEASGDELRGPITDYAIGFSRNSKRQCLPYGNDAALDVLCGEKRLAPCGWQTVAWSHGRVSKYACMLQQAGYVLADTSDHNNILMPAEFLRMTWNPNITTTRPQPKPKEDDEMLTIWWCERNDPWLVQVAIPFLQEQQGEVLDPNHEHGFRVEGPTYKYIGRHAEPGHEGWDPRTLAVRAQLALMGFPNLEREAHGIKSDLWTATGTLQPHTLPGALLATSVELKGTDFDAIVQRIADASAKATIEEITS